jgi:signal transduction histidine kinase
MIGDSVRLRQVFRNILSNAMKFTPNNDIIAVGVKRRDSSVRIAFADHGPGVPEEELEAVFDKFIQSSKTRSGAGGTGLGLAICREIVESHDGRIWAENQPEGGACFIIELPLANAFAATNSQGEAVGSESTEPLSATASGST